MDTINEWLWVGISVGVLVAALAVFVIFGAYELKEHVRGRRKSSPSRKAEPRIAGKLI